MLTPSPDPPPIPPARDLILSAEVAVYDERLAGGAVARPLRLKLIAARRERDDDGVAAYTLRTDRGEIIARYHAPPGAELSRRRGVVWVGGAGGGLDGPAGGLYPAASGMLQSRGVASLRIHYRRPNELPECVLDTLLAVAFLRQHGVDRVALVGHSFGGAVVISAGALSNDVSAVVPLATQTHGTELTGRVSPRPMLIVHGTADEVLPPVCAQIVYAAAGEPKQLKLFPGAGHGLDSVREELLVLLVDWLDART